MATHVSVVDTSFGRHNIKVTPATFMTKIRDEACTKAKTKTKNYDLKYKNKIVDLSQSFRQTGLPSGANLELVVASRSAGVVSVALQHPDGGRLMDKVPSDTTLWRILRKFESAAEGKNLNFTARGVTEVANGAATGAGRIFYEMPCLNIVGRECATFGDLQKTLQQLGINNGTAMIRLSFRKTEQPLEEAITEIREYFKEEEALEGSGSAGTVTAQTEVTNITEAVSILASEEPAGLQEKGTGSIAPEASGSTPEGTTPYIEPVGDVPLPVTPSKRSAPISKEEPSFELNQRRIEVYLPPSADTPRAALAPHNEADFEPTLGHLQSVQGRLQNSTQNKRLPSDAEIEREEEERAAKLSAVKELRIKIRLADQSLAIATLYTTDDAAVLYDLVKSAIAAEDQPFKLVWTDHKGRRTVPQDSKVKLIKDLGFSERMLVNFHWEDSASASVRKAPTLKSEILKKAKALQVPEVVALAPNDSESGPGVDKGKGKEVEGQGSGKGKGKVPSWLLKGLSKK